MHRKKIFWVVVALLLGLLPNLVWGLVGVPANAFKLGVAPNLALLIGCMAWAGRRPGAVILFLLPFSLLVPAECYYIWNFQGPSSVHVLGVLGETNLREAREYIGDGSLLALLASSVFSLVFFIIALKNVGLRYLFPAARAWRWVGVAAMFPVLSLFAFESSLALRSTENDVPSAWGGAQSQQFGIMLRNVNFKVSDVLGPGFPFGVPLRFWSYAQERQRLLDAKNIVDGIQVSASNQEGSAEKATLILVIGESANSENWGVNGYARDTTPQVAAMADAVSLRNVVTPWTATRLSVPVLLTGQQDRISGMSPLEAPSLLAIFRAAGWKTYWLSNQAPLGQHDSAIGLYAAQADVVRYFSVADFNSTANTDDVLIKPVLKVLKSDLSPRKLIVVHLLGSHVEYHFRYPSSFNRFQPSGTDSSEPGELKTLMNSYDNSIFFTDYLLAQFVGLLNKNSGNENSSLIYVSDHGQALPTYECPQWGHSHIAETTYRVPAMIWMSKESQRSHKGALARLKAVRDQPLHTSQVFDTVIDLAKIETSSMQLQKSWISPEWRPARRLIRAGADFDEIRFGGSCRTAQTSIERR